MPRLLNNPQGCRMPSDVAVQDAPRFGWIIFYTNTITKKSAVVALTLFALLSTATFPLLLLFFWRHNQTTYKRRYSEWERSFLCQRCGTVTEQE